MQIFERDLNAIDSNPYPNKLRKVRHFKWRSRKDLIARDVLHWYFSTITG